MMYGVAGRFSSMLLVIALAAPWAAAAQTAELSPLLPQRHLIFATLGAEPAVTLSLGYSYRLAPPESRSGIRVGGSVKLPTTALSHGAWRVDLFGAADWRSASHWGAAVTSGAYLARNHNRAGRMYGLGLEVRAAPGYYGRRYAAALDLGWQGAVLSHIRHSEEARRTFDDRYPDGAVGVHGPRDGWYGSAAQRVRIGVTGSRTLGDGAVLDLAFGSLFVAQAQGVLLGFDFAQLPFYLESSVRLGR